MVIIPSLKRHRIDQQQHSNPALESYSLAPPSANAWFVRRLLTSIKILDLSEQMKGMLYMIHKTNKK